MTHMTLPGDFVEAMIKEKKQCFENTKIINSGVSHAVLQQTVAAENVFCHYSCFMNIGGCKDNWYMQWQQSSILLRVTTGRGLTRESEEQSASTARKCLLPTLTKNQE